jgi:hypothetical protein
MRALRTLAVGLVSACVVGGVTAPSASASSLLLDPISPTTFNNYCVHLGGSSARAVTSDVYGWRCVSASGTESPISVDDVCLWAVPNTFPHTKSRIREFHSVDGWQCWGFNATLGALTLGDFSDFCRSRGFPDGAKVIPPEDAYSIRCEPGDQVLSVTDVCRRRFNSPDAQDLTGDFYYAISWTCWDGLSPGTGGTPPSTTTTPSVACAGAGAGPCPATPTPGRACLFINPRAMTPINRGQIAWAYRRTTEGTWRFGSTDGPFRRRDGWDVSGHSWSKTSRTFGGVLDAVRAEAGPYTSYRCTNVSASSADDADQAVAAQSASGHLALTTNCLARAVAILRAYGATLPAAGGASFPASPNDYVAEDLAGWEAAKPLAPGGAPRSAFSVPGAPIELHGARPTVSLSVFSRAAGSLEVLLYSPAGTDTRAGPRRVARRVYLRRTLAIDKGRSRVRLRSTRRVARGRHAARLILALRSRSGRRLGTLGRSAMLVR